MTRLEQATEATGTPPKAGAVGSQVDLVLGPLPPYVYGWECGHNERVLPFDEAMSYAAKLVAAERERCVAIARRWGETHADGVTVNARNAASKIARGIEGPNVRANRPWPQQEER